MEIVVPLREVRLIRDPPCEEEQQTERTDERPKRPMIAISTMKSQFSKTARPPQPKHSLAWEQYGGGPGKVFKPLLSIKSTRSIQNRPPDHGPIANETINDGMN
jgi:hypothetical protein